VTAGRRPIVALVFVGMIGAWAGGLVEGYDAASHSVTIPAIGQTIQLGGKPKGDAGHRFERGRGG